MIWLLGIAGLGLVLLAWRRYFLMPWDRSLPSANGTDRVTAIKNAERLALAEEQHATKDDHAR